MSFRIDFDLILRNTLDNPQELLVPIGNPGEISIRCNKLVDVRDRCRNELKRVTTFAAVEQSITRHRKHLKVNIRTGEKHRRRRLNYYWLGFDPRMLHIS